MSSYVLTEPHPTAAGRRRLGEHSAAHHRQATNPRHSNNQPGPRERTLGGSRAGKEWGGGVGDATPSPKRRKETLAIRRRGAAHNVHQQVPPMGNPWETPLETHGVGRASPPAPWRAGPACAVSDA